jgi:hypothetical protein
MPAWEDFATKPCTSKWNTIAVLALLQSRASAVEKDPTAAGFEAVGKLDDT